MIRSSVIAGTVRRLAEVTASPSLIPVAAADGPAWSMSSLGTIRLAAVAVALATALGAEVAGAAYIGSVLDRRWSTAPWLALLGAFGGLTGGILMLLAALKRVQSDGSDGA
ncbi:MAG: hypothetical protein ACE149_12445 [Armatimonadota bacterium]